METGEAGTEGSQSTRTTTGRVQNLAENHWTALHEKMKNNVAETLMLGLRGRSECRCDNQERVDAGVVNQRRLNAGEIGWRGCGQTGK